MTDLIQKIIWNSSQRTAIFFNKKSYLSDLQKYAQIGKISSGIIHDLMSPITALNMQIEIFNNKIKDRDILIKSIKETSKEINNYSKIVKDYISGFREKENLFLDQEIQNSLKLLSCKAKENNVQIQFIRKPKIKLYSNKIFIYQIIISLVSNAIESFKDQKNKRKVIVKLEKNNKKITISIKDFGIGIKDTKIIFKTFYTTKKDFGGTGIGLSNVKYIVEKELKGKLEVKSELNRGSEFKIII